MSLGADRFAKEKARRGPGQVRHDCQMSDRRITADRRFNAAAAGPFLFRPNISNLTPLHQDSCQPIDV
jgi:hypothetical protein